MNMSNLTRPVFAESLVATWVLLGVERVDFDDEGFHQQFLRTYTDIFPKLAQKRPDWIPDFKIELNPKTHKCDELKLIAEEIVLNTLFAYFVDSSNNAIVIRILARRLAVRSLRQLPKEVLSFFEKLAFRSVPDCKAT